MFSLNMKTVGLAYFCIGMAFAGLANAQKVQEFQFLDDEYIEAQGDRTWHTKISEGIAVAPNSNHLIMSNTEITGRNIAPGAAVIKSQIDILIFDDEGATRPVDRIKCSTDSEIETVNNANVVASPSCTKLISKNLPGTYWVKIRIRAQFKNISSPDDGAIRYGNAIIMKDRN